MEEGKRRATVHDRYHIGCSCCGLVSTAPKKREAIKLMVGHMDRHPELDERMFSVFDSMHRSGGRVIYGGRIYNGIRGHVIGVGYQTGRASAAVGSH